MTLAEPCKEHCAKSIHESNPAQRYPEKVQDCENVLGIQ